MEVKKRAQSCRLHGSDIDSEAIEWANQHLPDVGVFSVNSSMPPTRYRDAFFDIIYTVSLFTHLDEDTQIAWLAELARLVKPGGWVLATLHGTLTRSSCTAFHSRKYVERVWTRWFELVEYVEGGVGQHQDIVVLRRPT